MPSTVRIPEHRSTHLQRMPSTIDYEFISQREGGRILKGYVPAADVSKSGVTVATGFDIGQRNAADLKGLGLDTALVEKLTPYIGKNGPAAVELLKKSPLTLTADEALSIDKATKQAAVALLRTRYLASIDNKKNVEFNTLPSEAQTAVASVSFQYGNLSIKAPKFWKAACEQDWKQAAKILKNFGDEYPTRRKLESQLIENIAE